MGWRNCANVTRVQVVRNATTWGSRRQQRGHRAATGDIDHPLNNDTYVTRGWMRRLIRPLLRDERVGLSGPLTNNIGNEQKVALRYDTMEEMQGLACSCVATLETIDAEPRLFLGGHPA